MFSMFRKMICLVSFVLVLSLVGDVQAVDVIWTDTTGDHLWSTEGNWEGSTLPTSVDRARMNDLPGPTIAKEGAVARVVHVGYAGQTGALTVDGGTFNTTGWFSVGQSTGSEGILNMKNGTLNINGGLMMGQGGLGTLNMTGGTITITASLRIGAEANGTGHVDLYGGIITTNNFEMRMTVNSVGTMDVRASGTLIIDGNNISTVQGYIDSGWITAYDGNGRLQMDYDVTNQGKTTLSATHFLNPNPVDGSPVSPGEVELSWTLPDPCVPGEAVPVDVYFTDNLTLLEQFTDPAAIRVVSKQNVTSVVVQTQPKTRYYWAVDTYVDSTAAYPVIGPIFSFFADNMPPEVDAGVDVVTWLEEGSKTGNLDATVTDDGAISPYTVQWSVVSEPIEGAAVIETTTAEDTSITLTELGEYVLQLEAFDGEYSGSDTVTINVYNDNCEATRSLPDYVPLVGDLNGDCRVDEADMALLEENWLQDNLLTEDWFKVE